MKEQLVATRTIQAEDGSPLTLQYMILSEEMPRGPESYGVRITEGEGGASSVAPGLTTSNQKIQDLVETLAKNTVTPTGLMDVLADWME